MKTKAVIDTDALLYAIGFVGEERSIKVVNTKSGDEYTYKNRTEFWGRGKKIGGVLAEMNKQRDKEDPLSKDDFEVFDIQVVTQPLANVLHSAKTMYEARIEMAKCDEHVGYIGGAENFRVERSTIVKYKGNRDNVLRPLLKDEIVEYYIKHQGVQVVNKIETDDQCVMDCHNNNNVLVGVDKDYYGCNVKFLNSNRVDEGAVDCSGFGSLWLNEKKEVRGHGRLFFYWQVANGDDSDNYFANSAAPEHKWADISAYNALKDCRNDVEALQALKNVYTTLYPTPKEIIGWRGDKIKIDWAYVLNENWDLARMLRFNGDVVIGTDVMKKFGVVQ